MSSSTNPTTTQLNLYIETNPEIKSFVWQSMAAFEPYITSATSITVVARDPKKLAIQYETDGIDISEQELEKLYRIAIVLKEDDTQIEFEGVDVDVYLAITKAQNGLLKKLAEIQDSVVSNQDRLIEINHYLQNTNVH